LKYNGDHSAAVRALAAAGYGTPLPNPAVEHRHALTEILGHQVPDPPPPPPVPPPGRVGWTPEVDASNPAIAADWLRDQVGRGRLAGYFNRAGQIAYTPRQGEDGYVPTSNGQDDEDGPAQIWPVNDSTLASRITYTYGVYKQVKRGDDYMPVPALFPRPAARTAVDAADMMPHLRLLRGVVHSPVLRGDGTVLADPGYDPDTALLYLPEPGLHIPAVAGQPDGQAVADAVALLDRMIDGFAFVSKDHRANYLGALLTPLLRELAPPPYQLVAITAPQPGSGKTLLATVARLIHGGVFRAELPGDDDELRKQITTILDHTTGPVVHFDNVSGTVRSSVVAGLLTSARWDDRRLGTNIMVNARNDRLWVLTGNNLALGGDLTRRTIWVTIDPGVPDPHLRTGFAITDLERWVRDQRGPLLHALLTLARAWVTAGMPITALRSSDSYSRWTQVIAGILACAGIEGQFAAVESARQEIGTDDEEWHEFLTRVHQVMGAEQWTVKELLGRVDTGSLIAPGEIPLDALPSDLAEKAARPNIGVTGIAKSLGRWLRNREGRWVGRLTVRCAGMDRTKTALWKIRDGGDNNDQHPESPQHTRFQTLQTLHTTDQLDSKPCKPCTSRVKPCKIKPPRDLQFAGFAGFEGFDLTSAGARAYARVYIRAHTRSRAGRKHRSKPCQPCKPQVRHHFHPKPKPCTPRRPPMTHFQSTTVTETRCPRCHRAILTALDEGLRVTADTTPLPNPQAEVAAILDNRRTYTRTQFGWLIFRDARPNRRQQPPRHHPRRTQMHRPATTRTDLIGD
jgi:hypothetical protein